MRLLTAPINQAVPFKTEAGALHLRTPTEATTILASWELCHPVVPHRPHTSSRISAPSFALLEDILLQTAHFFQAAPPLQLCRRTCAHRELCRQLAATKRKPSRILLVFANLESMQFLTVPIKQAVRISVLLKAAAEAASEQAAAEAASDLLPIHQLNLATTLTPLCWSVQPFFHSRSLPGAL